MIDARQTNGRFAKGNPRGPGRPPCRTEADYLAANSATRNDERESVSTALDDG